MAYNTPETVADYLARFQMEITHRGKGTFTPDHVKYSLTILPGDDKGEDGYSLSGEARDAATSRNGLNENRKSVAEMIQECFDSIENNGDAI